MLASMQLVHGGEVGDDIELDSEGVHLQRELARCLCQLHVGLLAERVRGAPKPDVQTPSSGLGRKPAWVDQTLLSETDRPIVIRPRADVYECVGVDM